MTHLIKEKVILVFYHEKIPYRNSQDMFPNKQFQGHQIKYIFLEHTHYPANTHLRAHYLFINLSFKDTVQ